jgi:hypothetical protein
MLIIDCLMESNERHGCVMHMSRDRRACINEMCHRHGAGRRQKMYWPGLQVGRRVLSACVAARVPSGKSYVLLCSSSG